MYNMILVFNVIHVLVCKETHVASVLGISFSVQVFTFSEINVLQAFYTTKHHLETCLDLNEGHLDNILK